MLEVAETIIKVDLNFDHALAVSSVFRQPHRIELKISSDAFLDPMLKTEIET